MWEFSPGTGPRVWLEGIRSSVVAPSISESSFKKKKEREKEKSHSNLLSSRQIHVDRYPSENIEDSSICLPFQFSKMLTLSQMSTV